MTIRTQLALWYAGLLTLIIVVFSVVVFSVVRATTINSIDEGLQQTGMDVIQNVRIIVPGELGADHLTIIFHSLNAFRLTGTSVQVWQTYDTGKESDVALVRSSMDISEYEVPLDLNALHAATIQFNNVYINDVPARVMTHPIYGNYGQQIGIVQVAVPIHVVEQTTDLLFIIMLLACAIAIIVATILGMLISRRVLRPIQDITEAASSIMTAKNLDTRLRWRGPMDELGRLTNVFNDMMERLESLFRVQQRFVADVSHELRTPLTAIQGNLEVIERYGMDSNSLSGIREESERMTRMVNDLLLLARADYGELMMDLYPIDVDQIVLEVYEQAHTLTKGRQIKMLLGKFEPVSVHGNADRLKQVVLNLVSNAIKFTPDEGTITLSAFPNKGEAIIEVSDTGIGIKQADQELIFNRFYQADHSRVHTRIEDGAGLGLSIVQWIVDVHKGRVDIESTFRQGSTFRVCIPAVQQPTASDKTGSKDLGKNIEINATD